MVRTNRPAFEEDFDLREDLDEEREELFEEDLEERGEAWRGMGE